MNYTILLTKSEGDHVLLDSGDGEKLERYGKIVIARPDPQALWLKRLPENDWKKANAWFTRTGEKANWETDGTVSGRWAIDFADLKFYVKLSPFKHTGLFPEQASNWGWLRQQVESRKLKVESPVSILNLFGYTGGASLACAQAGAAVCHVDSSKTAVAWARDNAELSGLKAKPIRWIVDDARAFVRREIKRGRKYDGIILDPPAFGHGPEGELWKIEEHFLGLLADCRALLSPQPLFFLINGYAAGYSAIAYQNCLQNLVGDFGGAIEIGELTIAESKSERLLPAGIFARWSG